MNKSNIVHHLRLNEPSESGLQCGLIFGYVRSYTLFILNVRTRCAKYSNIELVRLTMFEVRKKTNFQHSLRFDTVKNRDKPCY